MIERKRRPTWKITQQPNQSPNRPVQKATLRTPKRRAVCAPEDALVCASVDAPFACREALRAGRRAVLRAVRRAACARKTRRVRVACARGRRAACTPCARRPVRVLRQAGVAWRLSEFGRGRGVADGAASQGRRKRGAFPLL